MKTILKIAMGVAMSFAASQVRGDEVSDKKKHEFKAKAALALAATAPKGFVNVAPVPRVIPDKMPAKKPCDCCKGGEKCPCGSDCGCSFPGECLTPKKVEVKAQPKLEIVGYQLQQVCENGRCRYVQVPVYGYR